LGYSGQCELCGTGCRSLKVPTYSAKLEKPPYITVRATLVAWETPPDVALTVIM
jgi:hypothetical protein